jgi:hypothetical protein
MALRTAIEIMKDLRYKLQMMGIPLDGHAQLHVDNKSVVCNTTSPEWTLKKKCNSISYHNVCESIATGISRVAYKAGKRNKADMLTKIRSGVQREDIAETVLF